MRPSRAYLPVRSGRIKTLQFNLHHISRLLRRGGRGHGEGGSARAYPQGRFEAETQPQVSLYNAKNTIGVEATAKGPAAAALCTGSFPRLLGAPGRSPPALQASLQRVQREPRVRHASWSDYPNPNHLMALLVSLELEQELERLP